MQGERGKGDLRGGNLIGSEHSLIRILQLLNLKGNKLGYQDDDPVNVATFG